jgi:hypothetical protein
MRSLLIAVALIAVAAPALAQTPSSTTLPVLPTPHASATPHPHPSPRPTAVMTFTNPAPKRGQQATANGTTCTRNGVAAQQQHINPITGQPQASTIVSVPITGGSGSIASATNRQQQLEACAHGH